MPSVLFVAFDGAFRFRRLVTQRKSRGEFAAVPVGKQRGEIGNSLHQGIEPGFVAAREIRQDIARHMIAMAGMTDAEPEAQIIPPDMGVDVLKPVMAAGAAAALGFDPPGRKVKLVMDDDEIDRKSVV